MSWDEADGIKQRAVKRGLARKVPAVMARLCVDEKGMGRGQMLSLRPFGFLEQIRRPRGT
jgi:hypothetical protein